MKINYLFFTTLLSDYLHFSKLFTYFFFSSYLHFRPKTREKQIKIYFFKKNKGVLKQGSWLGSAAVQRVLLKDKLLLLKGEIILLMDRVYKRNGGILPLKGGVFLLNCCILRWKGVFVLLLTGGREFFQPSTQTSPLFKGLSTYCC